MIDESLFEHQGEKHRNIFGVFVFGGVVVSVLGALSVLWYLNTPRVDFPVGERLVIPDGATLTDISHILEEAHVVRSSILFQAIITALGKQTALHAGEHTFPVTYSAYGVARAFLDQTTLVPPARVTIPEGSTVDEFDTLIHQAVPRISAGSIREAVGGQEGVLFPDTYLIPATYTADDIARLLKETFDEKLAPYATKLAENKLSKEQVITLASIVEREANDEASMKVVAGILLHRLEMNMPLQVDATFDYLFSKESAELTADDLEVDSPYNTYNNRGLPPTPIASPGITAIEAVLFPAESDYLYYLTDRDGVFHYARTFEEHKENKARYLR